MAEKRNPYFKFYPADFMGGVRGMTAQEVGVYTMLLCRMYEEDGPIGDDAFRLSTYCGMREATFTSTLEKLVRLGKIERYDGMLSNDRARHEISNRADGLEVAIRAGKLSAEKRQQKQRSNQASVEPAFNHTDTDTDTDTDKYGGGGSAREAENTTFRERILSACSVDPVSGLTGHGGRQIGTQADMAEATRWLQLPGITEATAIEEITRLMAGKRDGPPKSFAYFTSAMQRLSGELSAPDLQPTTPTPRGPANDRRSEQRAFGAAIQQLADGLSSGSVKLDTASRDPWRQ